MYLYQVHGTYSVHTNVRPLSVSEGRNTMCCRQQERLFRRELPKRRVYPSDRKLSICSWRGTSPSSLATIMRITAHLARKQNPGHPALPISYYRIFHAAPRKPRVLMTAASPKLTMTRCSSSTALHGSAVGAHKGRQHLRCPYRSFPLSRRALINNGPRISALLSFALFPTAHIDKPLLLRQRG